MNKGCEWHYSGDVIAVWQYGASKTNETEIAKSINDTLNMFRYVKDENGKYIKTPEPKKEEKKMIRHDKNILSDSAEPKEKKKSSPQHLENYKIMKIYRRDEPQSNPPKKVIIQRTPEQWKALREEAKRKTPF